MQQVSRKLTFTGVMQKLIYTLAYAFLWLITWLPLSVLFKISDILFLAVYYLFGYRKNVVRQNLLRSFPEKSTAELRSIERNFYRHLCDSFVEWIYPLHRSAKELEKHYNFSNPELLNELYAQKKGVVGILGHYGNWEFLSLLPQFIDHPVLAIHQPLANTYFNTLINRLRSKYGVEMITAANSFRRLMSDAQNNNASLTYFLSDQSPHRDKIHYWTTFLNQPTPIFLGAEQIATKLDIAVVFIDIKKRARGKYEVEFQLLAKNPKDYAAYEITEMHVKALENRIKEQPAYWLWSHRRWKYGQDQSQNTDSRLS